MAAHPSPTEPTVTTARPPAAARSKAFATPPPGPASAAPAPAPSRARLGARGMKNISTWSRQLLILVRSGMPLADAMTAIERQTPEGAWKDVLGDVNRQVEEGSPLTDAMAEHPKDFDSITRGLIAAGESSGQLDVMLERLAQLSRQQLRLRRSLIGAMVYPCLLMGVASVVVAVMLCFVLPRFEKLFGTLNVTLPPTTKFLIALSNAVQSSWWALALGALAAAVAVKMITASRGGQRALALGIVRVPHFGGIVKSLETARLARLLGVLLESRVPVLEALALTGQATRNVLFGELLAETGEAVERGLTISQVLSESDLIDTSFAEAIHHGELGGQTGQVLSNLADFMDEDNETVIRTLTSVLEPLIMVVLGSIIGVIAVSLFLPLFDLTASAGGA